MLGTETSNLFKALGLRSRMGINTNSQELEAILWASNADKIHLLKDKAGINIGYVVWAGVCRETVDRLNAYGIQPQYEYEFNEGSICLIKEVLLLSDRSYEAKLALKVFLLSKRLIVFSRRNKCRIAFRVKNRMFLTNFKYVLNKKRSRDYECV